MGGVWPDGVIVAVVSVLAGMMIARWRIRRRHNLRVTFTLERSDRADDRDER